MTKYALYTYTTGNIGDDIQSLATSRFWPRVDYYINRDYMNDFQPDTDEQIKLIMNGWYSHRPENFPLKNDQIDPLLISMYFDEQVKPAFSSAANQAFFKKYEPVGARSQDTKDFMESLGVDSYWSGCVTLTLEPEEYIRKQDFILAIDLPQDVLKKVQKDSKLSVIVMGADVAHQHMNPTLRAKVAKYYLYLYQSARFVITTRLHGTLPCLGLGTPVLNIELPNFEESRFRGLRELAHHMTAEEFLAGGYDVNQPLENPDAYLKVRKELEQRCEAFTGYVSPHGFLQGQTVSDFLSDPELIQSFMTGLWAAHHHFGIWN